MLPSCLDTTRSGELYAVDSRANHLLGAKSYTVDHFCFSTVYAPALPTGSRTEHANVPACRPAARGLASARGHAQETAAVRSVDAGQLGDLSSCAHVCARHLAHPHVGACQVNGLAIFPARTHVINLLYSARSGGLLPQVTPQFKSTPFQTAGESVSKTNFYSPSMFAPVGHGFFRVLPTYTHPDLLATAPTPPAGEGSDTPSLE